MTQNHQTLHPNSPDMRRHEGVKSRVWALFQIGFVCMLKIFGGINYAMVAGIFFLCVSNQSVLKQAIAPVMQWRRQLRVLIMATAVILVIILIVPLLLKLAQIPPPDHSELYEELGGHVAALPYLLLWIWTVVAFGEEMLGRVFLVSRFETLLKGMPGATMLSVIFSAILFGLAHEYQGTGGIILTAMIGLILGLLYIYQQRNIWVNVIVHGIIDTIGVLLIVLDVRIM